MSGITLKNRPSSEIPSPPAGKKTIFVDSADGVPKLKDSVGAISTFPLNPNANVGYANVLDYGADRTGAASSEAAINAAIAAVGASGGIVFFPAGSYRTTSNPFDLTGNQITFRGAGSGATYLTTTSTTGNQLRLSGYGSKIEDLCIQGPGTGTTSQKTAGYGLEVTGTTAEVKNVDFTYQFEGLHMAGHLVDYDGGTHLYFNRCGIVVNHQSDHRIASITMNNAAATPPTLAGIDVRVTASLVLDRLNIITSNFALNISPLTGVTIPSVKGTNCFFDTSAVGLNMQGAGSVFRSEFTNCWFSSQTIAGIRMDPAAGGNIDGITFVNCDIYQNIAGTTNGVIAGALVRKWKMVGCSIAGWTNGINLAPGPNHFPTILSNSIGAISAFAVNTVGILVGAGTYRGLVLANNDVVDNTTALTLGALTIAAGTAPFHRIIDNAGINPRGAVTTPAVGAVNVVTTNNTGFRVIISAKAPATGMTGLTINGVATPQAPAASQAYTVTLEPGGTISSTGAALASWVWVGQ